MRTTFTLALSAISGSISAQCPHDPLITPPEVILCPGESITLTTQEADGYQWLKDGMPIPGALAQEYTVNYSDDGGSLFNVIATVDGCSETSPGVLVDGWAFLFPYVIHEGDEPAFIGGNGESYYCPDAFVQLVAGSVAVNIQWTFNGQPIPDANGQSIVPVESGYYSMSGAPAVCPDFIMQLGLEIPIFFIDPIVPAIVPIGDQLCLYPTSPTFQWYLNGEPITADACFTPSIGGTYTVAADYEGCGMVLSEPYDLALGIDTPVEGASMSAFPNPASDAITVTADAPLLGSWQLTDASGRLVLAGRFEGSQSAELALNGLEPGNYLLAAKSFAAPLRIAVVR